MGIPVRPNRARGGARKPALRFARARRDGPGQLTARPPGRQDGPTRHST